MKRVLAGWLLCAGLANAQGAAEAKVLLAEEVFKNIKTLKGVPAIGILGIMKIGYSKSLGVDCTYCHTPGQWEKDDVPKKQVAREMSLMMKGINTKYLKQIKNLDSKEPSVNCTTCHRGDTKPALDMP